MAPHSPVFWRCVQLDQRDETGTLVATMRVEVSVGPLLIEVRQTFDVHTELTTR